MARMIGFLALLLALLLSATALAEALPAADVPATEEIVGAELLPEAQPEEPEPELEAIPADPALDAAPEAEALPASEENALEAAAQLEDSEAAEDDEEESDEAFEAEAEEVSASKGADCGDGADNDALFEGYAAEVLGLPGGIASANRHVGLELTGVNLRVYRKLAAVVEQVAAGERTKTKFSFTPEELGVKTKLSRKQLRLSNARRADADDVFDALNIDLMLVYETLAVDYPNELYWFDQFFYYGFTGSATKYTLKIKRITFDFCVASDYARKEYEVDPAKITAAHAAVANARQVVSDNAAFTDEQKLRNYVKYICDHNTYNDEMYQQYLEGADVGQNPWQIIYVFDGDPETNVVCEGYAKALKYLCDLTDFRGNVYCYVVSSRNHMWNIVTMPDGWNYHVDATWTDEADEESFVLLPAVDQKPGEWYTVRTNLGVEYDYTFSGETMAVYPESVLTLAWGEFDGGEEYPEQARGLYFAEGSSLKLTAGDRHALRLGFEAENTDPVRVDWFSSNPSVATVNDSGVVTAKKKGKAVITARAFNECSASITVKVVKKAKLEHIDLPEGVFVVNYNETPRIEPIYTPWNGRSKLTWSSSDPKVVRVNGSGVLTPVRAGTATITVKSANGKKASMTVEIADPDPPDTFEVCGYDNVVIQEGDVLSVLAGEELTFFPEAYRQGEVLDFRRVTWSSSNPGVGVIGGDGTFYTQGPGTTTITARAADGLERAFNIYVARNRVEYGGAPTMAEIQRMKGWGLQMKSLEIFSPERAVAEFYFVNRSLEKSSFVRNFAVDVDLFTDGGDEDEDFYYLGSGRMGKLKAKCRKNGCVVLKVNLSIGDENSWFDLTSGAFGASYSWSGKLK